MLDGILRSCSTRVVCDIITKLVTKTLMKHVLYILSFTGFFSIVEEFTLKQKR